MLVSVGAALFTLVSAYGWSDFTFSQASGVTFDPTRVAAQIVSGIGFLGAGAIIRQGLSVRGLTTATTLWVVAAIGMASGAGYYSGAVITTALVLVALWPLRIAARRLYAGIRAETGRLVVDVRAGQSGAAVLDVLEHSGVRVLRLEFDQEADRRNIGIDVELPARARPTALVAELMRRDEVLGAEWTD
jgi:putative Mg2+ transporter-C (MgtC) family protein